MEKLPRRQLVDIIIFKAIYNLRSESTTTRLGYAWWVLEPMLHMLTFYLVFSVLLSRGGDNYVVFLFSGLIPWLWFSKSINRMQGSILAGKALMNQIYMPKIIFPCILLVQDAIKQIAIFGILIIGLLLMGIKPTILWFWLFPIYLCQLILISGCGFFASMLVPFFKDLRNVIPALLQFLMFSSGIFFDYTTIPEKYHNIFLLNPIASLIKCYRDVIVNGLVPNFLNLLFVVIFGLIFLIISLYVIKKFDYIYPRVVSE